MSNTETAPSQIPPEHVLRPAADLIYREIAGEAMLIPLRREAVDLQHLFALNPVAGFIWQSIDGTRTVADIASRVVAEFDVTESTAMQDLEEFVGELTVAGLIDTPSA